MHTPTLEVTVPPPPFCFMLHVNMRIVVHWYLAWVLNVATATSITWKPWKGSEAGLSVMCSPFSLPVVACVAEVVTGAELNVPFFCSFFCVPACPSVCRVPSLVPYSSWAWIQAHGDPELHTRLQMMDKEIQALKLCKQEKGTSWWHETPTPHHSPGLFHWLFFLPRSVTSRALTFDSCLVALLRAHVRTLYFTHHFHLSLSFLFPPCLKIGLRD